MKSSCCGHSCCAPAEIIKVLYNKVPAPAGRPLVYLANPYSGTKEIQQERFELACKAASWLMREFPHLNVFSPIVHSHPLHVIGNLRGDWTFWERIDREYISLSHLMVVLDLPGWEKSVGVTAELKIAAEQKIPVVHLDPALVTSPYHIDK
jgi:hypothetical protein